MSGRKMDKRLHSQTVLWQGYQGNSFMQRKMNGFIRKEKDEIKNKKGMYVTYNGIHSGSHDV